MPRTDLRLLLFLAPLALALSILPGEGEAQSGPNLDALLAEFSRLPGLEARFREEKRIALLAAPVRSEGTIHFAPPGRLMRRVERPTPSAALIDGGELRFREGSRIERIPIEGNPVLRGFVDSFRAVLAGDRAALERYYRVELGARPDAGDGAWRLVLRPRGEPLSRFLREIRMEGEGVVVERMVMIEVSGDETRTEFFDVDPARRYQSAESARIFSL